MLSSTSALLNNNLVPVSLLNVMVAVYGDVSFVVVVMIVVVFVAAQQQTQRQQ